MASIDVVPAIRTNDAGRDPARLALRYAAMRATPFAFLRATCHLYYARAHQRELLPDAPAGWVCGDLHLENFGSFRGANGLAYFDLSDFDEAALAPGTWDMLRLATSVLVWTSDRHRAVGERRALARIPVDAFAEALRSGKPHWVERATAEGPIRRLLRQVKRRSQRAQLAARIQLRGRTGVHRLRLDPAHTLRAPREERERITKALARFAARQPNPRIFRAVDHARRIAGLGSLGLPRWMVLVEGKRSPDGYRLLDLKGTRPSSVSAVTPSRQPNWSSDAARVVAIQRWLQAESPALLSTIAVGRTEYVLRELQPEQDRLRLGHLDRDPNQISKALRTMGRLAAWALLRGTGRQGAAVVDAWIDFAHASRWRSELLQRAQELARVVEADWREFLAAYDDGTFKDQAKGRIHDVKGRVKEQAV